MPPARFDLSLFVSAAEAAWFGNRLGEGSKTVTHVSNGVDTTYFDPELDLESPYDAGVFPVVFTGAMDYWANVDAVTWFAGQVWPRVRRERAHSVFFIVGSRPAREVLALAGRT